MISRCGNIDNQLTTLPQSHQNLSLLFCHHQAADQDLSYLSLIVASLTSTCLSLAPVKPEIYFKYKNIPLVFLKAKDRPVSILMSVIKP